MNASDLVKEMAADNDFEKSQNLFSKLEAIDVLGRRFLCLASTDSIMKEQTVRNYK